MRSLEDLNITLDENGRLTQESAEKIDMLIKCLL